ncbi:hypothetical protein BASA82_000139 [Batrachochytrium salamandrivorans]|nr:hypothetical protein BASA81_001631 [Batrachochytrium salamandrivorans]KAH9262847.1 hypothetical protein BASA82_000139 [Batrachochytrium salamandrivorans]
MADCPKPFGSVLYKRATEDAKHRFCFEVGGVTLRLKINRQTQDLAVLSFIDANDQVAAFPAGFSVIDNIEQPALYLGNQFILVWLNSYDVRFNGVTMLKISNQRQQSIFGSASVHKGYTVPPMAQQALQPQAQILEAEDFVLM